MATRQPAERALAPTSGREHRPVQELRCGEPRSCCVYDRPHRKLGTGPMESSTASMSSANAGSGGPACATNESTSRSGRPRRGDRATPWRSSGWTITYTARSRLSTTTSSCRAIASRACRGMRTSSALIVVIPELWQLPSGSVRKSADCRLHRSGSAHAHPTSGPSGRVVLLCRHRVAAVE